MMSKYIGYSVRVVWYVLYYIVCDIQTHRQHSPSLVDEDWVFLGDFNAFYINDRDLGCMSRRMVYSTKQYKHINLDIYIVSVNHI